MAQQDLLDAITEAYGWSVLLLIHFLVLNNC
jgi:hypothetical protein